MKDHVPRAARPDTADADPDTGWNRTHLRRAVSGLAWAAVAYALWAAHFEQPKPTGDVDLDASWQQALCQALVQGLQFGRDLVFTFGPLSALHHGRYQPELWWSKVLLWEFVWKGAVAWRWTQVVRAETSIAVRVWLVAALVLVPMPDDAWFMLLALAIGLRHAIDERPSWRALALDLLILAAAALVKFPYFVAGVLVALVAAARAAQRSLPQGAAVLGLAVAALLAVWLACGQSPLHIFAWIQLSTRIAARYPEGQAGQGSETELVVALAMLALFALRVATAWRGLRPIGVRAGAMAVLAGITFLTWRSAFTIPAERSVVLFTFMAVAPFLVRIPDARPGSEPAWPRRARRFAHEAAGWLVVVAALVAFHAHHGTDVIARTKGMLEVGVERLVRVPSKVAGLSELRRGLAAYRVALARTHALPRIRAAIGDGTVDLFGTEQALVFLNDLRWQPRPLLHPYLALSPDLAMLDEAFLLGPRAPDFVILRQSTTDNRPPGMENARALSALIRAYEPVLEERAALLFRRRPGPPRLEGAREVLRKTVRFGERIELHSIPGRVLRVSLRVEDTMLGRVRSAFLRPARVGLRVHSGYGSWYAQHAPVGMLEDGFIARPQLAGDREWSALYMGKPVPKLSAIVLAVRPEDARWFEPEAELVVESLDDLLPPPDPELAAQLVFSSFPYRPINSVASIGPFTGSHVGRELVLVGATSRLVFEVPERGGRARGTGGILPFDDGRAVPPVQFTLRLVETDGSTTDLWSADLQSPPKGEGIAARRFELDLPPGPPGRRMVLLTAPLDPKETFALAFWRKIELD